MDSNSVLEIFREITKIPRESGHEEPMTAYLQQFAKNHGLACKTDKIGNVVITKNASPGKENVPTIVIQGHQDMVCEKIAGCTHDFRKDPIDYVIEDGWMVAKETTLGADDGIGVAAGLSLLASDLPTGKIECLFTISEETGMDGAKAMKDGFITGKTLINLDSEDEGQIFVGCAGGITTIATFRYEQVNKAHDTKEITLKFFGGVGGHSGDDINKGRANTVQLMARFLYKEMGNYQLILLSGGGKSNAIARECEAIVVVPESQTTAFIDRFNKFAAEVIAEYSVTDPNLKSEAEKCVCTEKAIDDDTTRRLISALVSVHHGVLTMSQDIPGLVETSNNLACVKMNNSGEIRVCCSSRSSVESAKAFMADRVGACFKLAGAEVEQRDPYPGWKPNMESPILKKTVESYRKLFNQEPLVLAIHAGLECGLFLEKFPDLDMVSFGPTLRGVHTPGERLDLASNEKFVKLLVDVVCNFS